jgi:hypothetical protein
VWPIELVKLLCPYRATISISGVHDELKLRVRVGSTFRWEAEPEAVAATGLRGEGGRLQGWEPTSRVIPPNSTLHFDVEYVGRPSS